MNAAMHKHEHGLATPRDVCKEVRDHRKSIQSRRSISWCSSHVTLPSSCLCNFIWCAMLKCHIFKMKKRTTQQNYKTITSTNTMPPIHSMPHLHMRQGTNSTANYPQQMKQSDQYLNKLLCVILYVIYAGQIEYLTQPNATFSVEWYVCGIVFGFDGTRLAHGVDVKFCAANASSRAARGKETSFFLDSACAVWVCVNTENSMSGARISPQRKVAVQL